MNKPGCQAALAIIALTAVSLAMLASSALPDGLERDRYDPSTCKTDAYGKFYIALGRYVLAVPYTGTAMVGPIYPSMNMPRFVPPDPKEPEGCPGNPQQLESYAFVYYRDDKVADRKANALHERRPQADFIQLIRIRKDEEGAPSDHHGWWGEQLQPGDAHRDCAVPTIRE